MRRFHSFLIAAVLLGGTAWATDDAKVTRILYLQEIDSREAVTLLRSEVQVRQIAELRDLGVLVVKGVPDRVDRCESLLREWNAVVRVADPHEPEVPDRDEGPTETRVFRLVSRVRSSLPVSPALADAGYVGPPPNTPGIRSSARLASLDDTSPNLARNS